MTDGHIFLSYRSIEADFALKLAADLKNAGVNLWMDRLDIGIHAGDDWVQSLQDAIDNCAAVIAVLSPDYVQSKYCRRELKRADTLARSIFPVLLQNLERTEWPFEIQEKQYIDFRNWQDENDYRQQLTDLLQTLQEHFPTQFGSVPDAETRYLTSLIAELESRKGVLEYVELSAQADAPDDTPARPDPYQFDEWAAGFSMLVENPTTIANRHQDDGSRTHQEKIALKSIAEAVEKHPRFVLIGEPGAGKTTTIRKLARDAARTRLENPHTVPLPLFLYLPQWSEESTPLDFVRKHWPFQTDPTGLLKRGDVFLYLDGLNEMGAKGAEKVEKLQAWLSGEDAPTHVIITCRAGDYTGDLKIGELPTVQAEELSEPQIRQFAANYLKEKTDSFLERILPDDKARWEDAHSLFRLARNPYLLAALIFVYDKAPDSDLPRNNGALMQKMTRALWDREKQKQTLDWIPFEDMETQFGKLAFSMIDEARPVDVPMNFVLQFVSAETLRVGYNANFIEQKKEEIRFYHQSIQEYFAAIQLGAIGVERRLSAPKLSWSSRQSQKWDEVIIALSGITKRVDLLIKLIAEKDIYLAAYCIASGLKVSKSVVENIFNKLWQQLCSGKMLTYEASLKATSVIGQPFIGKLLKTVYSDKPDSREAAADILAEIGGENIVKELLYALRYANENSTKVVAVNALAQIGEAAISGLLDTAVSYHYAPFTRDLALKGLVQIGHASLPSILAIVGHVTSSMRIEAIYALGVLRDKTVIPLLSKTLFDDDSNVCYASAEALERIGTLEALEAVEYWRQGKS
ncbi:MAG: TIR domain-containing protein [Chloroflexota bacterium]